MRTAGLIRCGVLGVLLGGGTLAAHAQGTSMPSPGTNRLPATPMGPQEQPGFPVNDPLSAQQEARRARAQTDERQRKMQDDTAKLLKLAEELKAEMEKTNKFQMSLDVLRKAEEIEKLARDVKNRMKG